jgi:uncharacterized membrane protein
MPTLVVIAYRDETSAATAGEQVQRLVRHLQVEPDAVAVVRLDRDGRVELTTHHRPVDDEASWGMVWMLVFALLFARAAPRDQDDAGLGGMLELVAAGGVDERFRSAIDDRLGPGTSALFVAVEGEQADRVLDVLGPYGGEVLRTSLSADRLAALQQALHGTAPSGPAVNAGRDPARGNG